MFSINKIVEDNMNAFHENIQKELRREAEMKTGKAMEKTFEDLLRRESQKKEG